ncbi:hypothetical protein E2C01_025166 [Portunus trituberculatus]|uniref:Uncharacterized protein n=1 Tax=Portunus trituberculatus TaxID=210409 RepID=A0A5B7EEV2_PORTR|nr:hypothetical protein [Portunus trituberculatus]
MKAGTGEGQRPRRRASSPRRWLVWGGGAWRNTSLDRLASSLAGSLWGRDLTVQRVERALWSPPQSQHRGGILVPSLILSRHCADLWGPAQYLQRGADWQRHSLCLQRLQWRYKSGSGV